MEDGNAQSVIDGILDQENMNNEYGLQDNSQQYELVGENGGEMTLDEHDYNYIDDN